MHNNWCCVNYIIKTPLHQTHLVLSLKMNPKYVALAAKWHLAKGNLKFKCFCNDRFNI